MVKKGGRRLSSVPIPSLRPLFPSGVVVDVTPPPVPWTTPDPKGWCVPRHTPLDSGTSETRNLEWTTVPVSDPH